MQKPFNLKIMNTRKYPRTLEEAFGPYTGRKFEEVKRPFDREDKIVMWGCAVAFVALTIIVLFVPEAK